MNRTSNAGAWGLPMVLGIAVLCAVLSVRTARAETAGTARPATLEQQISHLEGALAESLRSRDWKMLELVLQGFKAVNLNGAAAEISFLHAERQAAWENVFNARPAQMEAWGLAARAKFGDANAFSTLRAMTSTPLSAVQPPAPALFRTQPAEAKAAQKAYAAYTLAVEKRDHALLCLALLKEAGIGQSALSALRAKEKASASVMGMGMGLDSSSQLVLAALAADPQAGWKGLLDFCAVDEEKISVDAQTAAFNFILTLANPPKYQTADAPFRVDQEIAALLPKDAATQLTKTFANLAKRWKPDSNAPYNCPLLSATYNLPQLEDSSELVSAIEGLKAKFSGPNAQYLIQQADAAIKKLRTTVAVKDAAAKLPANKDANGLSPANKPPKPPEEGF